jgi:hypothetical protein
VTLVVYAGGIAAGVVALAWIARLSLRQISVRLLACTIPVLSAVLLVMAYNQARFHSPFEYGARYLPRRAQMRKAYQWHRIPENFRQYVFAPIRVSRRAPWILHRGWPPLIYTQRAEQMSSMFLNSPFLLLALFVPLLFRMCGAQMAPLKIFTLVVLGSALLVFASLLPFISSSRRYMHDFVPALMIAAFIGTAVKSQRDVEWRRWCGLAWAVLLVSAFLHVHLAWLEKYHWSLS